MKFVQVTKADKRNTAMSKKWQWRNVNKFGFQFCHLWPIRTNSNTALIFSKGAIFATKCLFFLQKNTDIIKIKGVFVLNTTFSKTTYECILTNKISSFWHHSNKF